MIVSYFLDVHLSQDRDVFLNDFVRFDSEIYFIRVNNNCEFYSTYLREEEVLHHHYKLAFSLKEFNCSKTAVSLAIVFL